MFVAKHGIGVRVTIILGRRGVYIDRYDLRYEYGHMLRTSVRLAVRSWYVFQDLIGT